MPRFYTYSEFLLEEKVPLSSPLREYSVEDLGEGKFIGKKNNVQFKFSVNPIPENLEIYRTSFFEIVNSLENKIPSEMYAVLQEIQKLPYHFGNIFSISLSLNNVQELSLNLNVSQQNSLKNSELNFLKSDFASLNKQTKDNIIEYLVNLLEKAGVVLECLFFYTRSQDFKKFYIGKNSNAILEEYQKIIDLHQEKQEMVIDGPYESVKMQKPLSSQVDYAFWKIANKKNKKNWILRGIISPEILNSEKNVGKKIILPFTILDAQGKEISEEFSNFEAEKLESKFKDLNKS